MGPGYFPMAISSLLALAGLVVLAQALWPGATSTRLERWYASKLILILGSVRSEEHTSELQSLMRISYAVFCLNKKKYPPTHNKDAIEETTQTRGRRADTTPV